MKHVHHKWLVTFSVLSLLVLFMGQNKCDKYKDLKKLKKLKKYGRLYNDIKQTFSKPGTVPAGSKIYISFLSFQDAVTKSTMARTEELLLIEKYVLEKIEETRVRAPELTLNAPGHTIPNSDSNINRVIETTFAPNLTKNQKMDKITSQLMNPNKVDVIVTGHFLDSPPNPTITIRPLVIIKDERKFFTRNLRFSRVKLFAQDPKSGKIILSRSGRDTLDHALQEFIDEMSKL